MIDQAISGYHLISMRSHQHIDLKKSWNFSGKFKLLGISFNLSESDKTLENFTEKVQSLNQ
jgi:hypothetical protein